MKRLWKERAAVLSVIALAVVAAPFAAQSDPNDSQEEKFKYSFKWAFVPAASAEFTVKHEEREGRPVVVLEASARSSRLVDPLWKMRDKVKAAYFADTGKSIDYELLQHENLRQVETRIEFDNENGVAHSSWRKRKGKREWEEKEADVPFANAHDALTAAMLIRNLDFESQEECEIHVVSGKSLFKVNLKKVKTEQVKTKAGRFDAVKLALTGEEIYPPQDPSKKKEEKVESVYLWISKEDNPKLVKLQAKAFVGSVTAQLMK